MPRQSTFRKRKFCGNRFTTSQSKVSRDTLPQQNADNLQTHTNNKTSASGRKLNQNVSCTPDISQTRCNGFCIIDIEVLSNIISDNLICSKCHLSGNIQFVELLTKNNGLCSNLRMACNACQFEIEFRTSKQCVVGYEINARLVLGMRSMGRGQRAAKKFCAFMDLPSPPSRFQGLLYKILPYIENEALKSMKNAAAEAILENNGDQNIACSFDGSWQKRGHTSNNGVVSCISVDTGKVLDFECLTKYCQGCILKKRDHVGCVKNYEGKSGGMEVEGVKRIFSRSVVQNGVRYVKYLGDGDSRSFSCIADSKPYGNEYPVSKLECIGHVHKRMGSRLRKLKTTNKQILEDGKTLGGKGRLTDIEIDRLQQYYGMAIRNNVDNLESMKRAVWAIWFHRRSTNDNPCHGMCPEAPSTWCKYNLADDKMSYNHANSLPTAVCSLIKPIFTDLANSNLLSKCLHGKTQNTNECFNSVVWCKCPKNVFVGYKTLKYCICEAVITFNGGDAALISLLQAMEIHPGTQCTKSLIQFDKQKNSRSRFRNNAITTKTYERKKEVHQTQDSDDDYACGMH